MKRDYNKFISIDEWINESEKTEKRDHYGCIMLYAKVPRWEEDHTDGIDPNDVYTVEGDDSYGLEDAPHMTLLYGVHEDEIDPELIYDIMQNELKEISVNVKQVSIFENAEYDVVKYEIPLTKEIKNTREKLESMIPNTQTFKEFNPHVTISYVKPGAGKKYVRELHEPFEIDFHKAVYSFREENKEGEEEDKYKEYVFKDDIDKEIDLSNND